MENDEKILEQYKLFVNKIENAAKRRQSTNQYFLTINSALLAFLTLSKYLVPKFESIWIAIISLGGFFIAYLWFLIIDSYRKEKGAQYRVIHNIEGKDTKKKVPKLVPFDLFWTEWNYMRDVKYKEKTEIEMWIPKIFMILYFLLTIANLESVFHFFTAFSLK